MENEFFKVWLVCIWPLASCTAVILQDALKSNNFWPPKKAGIFEFLEFLKVVAYDEVPWGYFLMAKYKKTARFHPYMAIVRSIPDLALNNIFFLSIHVYLLKTELRNY